MAILSYFSSAKDVIMTRVNLSRSELKNLESMNVESIRNMDVKLRKTVLSKKTPEDMRQRVQIILNKTGQYNENGVHILSKYNTDNLKHVKVYETVSNALSKILEDKDNPLTQPEAKEVKQHFACYGVGLIERKINFEETQSVKKAKEAIKDFLTWIGVDQSDAGKSGLQASLRTEVDKSKLDVGLSSPEWRRSVTNQINQGVKVQINKHLSDYAEKEDIITPDGTTLTAYAIENWCRRL